MLLEVFRNFKAKLEDLIMANHYFPPLKGTVDICWVLKLTGTPWGNVVGADDSIGLISEKVPYTRDRSLYSFYKAALPTFSYL